MKFDQPATTNPIDQLKVIGQPVDRVDGPLKVTGRATYAYEQHAAAPNAAYGYVVGAGIAKGRIAAIDIGQARRAPGVLAVVHAGNAGKLDRGAFYVARALAGPQVDHYHQAVAVVVAQTLEQARAAAQLVRDEQARREHEVDKDRRHQLDLLNLQNDVNKSALASQAQLGVGVGVGAALAAARQCANRHAASGAGRFCAQCGAALPF